MIAEKASKVTKRLQVESFPGGKPQLTHTLEQFLPIFFFFHVFLQNWGAGRGSVTCLLPVLSLWLSQPHLREPDLPLPYASS